MSFRLSEKVTLNEGDKVRISSGPYYVSSSGAKISMGEKGVGTFVIATEDGTAIYVKFKNETPKYVYIGPEKVASNTGTIMRPHKVIKARR
jgi:hypothetical protein